VNGDGKKGRAKFGQDLIKDDQDLTKSDQGLTKV
jgi:hypothetical protein